MKGNLNLLNEVEALPKPRHLFSLPTWAPPGEIDKLVDEGYISLGHCQRDPNGSLRVAMNLRLTPKGEALIRRRGRNWPSVVLKGSLAGVSFAAMSLAVLYWA